MALNKQQIQYLVLGGIVGAGALYAVVTFGLAPLLSSIASSADELAVVESKIEEAQAVIRKREQIMREYKIAQDRIRHASENIPLPVYKNYLMDMKKTVLGVAEGLALTIDDVLDYDQQTIREGKSNFKQYRVRVNAKTSFSVLLEFLARIEEHNPYLSVVLVNITPQAADPEIHEVSLVLSWLIWADPDERPVVDAANAGQVP